MSNLRNLLAYLLALAVGLGLAWGGWSYYQATLEPPLNPLLTLDSVQCQ